MQRVTNVTKFWGVHGKKEKHKFFTVAKKNPFPYLYNKQKGGRVRPDHRKIFFIGNFFCKGGRTTTTF